MRYKDLLEYDPELAQALTRTAYGINRSADKLKGPIKLTQIQDKVKQSIQDLENLANDPANKGKDFALIFQQHLNNEKANAKIDGKMGFSYKTKPLKNPDGSLNSTYIRQVLTDFFSQFRKSADIGRKFAGINIDKKDKFTPIGTIKKGRDGQDYEWQGAQWSSVKTGKMVGSKLP